MELTNQEKQQVLDILSKADGEDIEQIINQSGFDKYLTRALTIKSSTEDLNYYIKERDSLTKEKMGSTQQLKHRLEIISEEATILRKFIEDNNLSEEFALATSKSHEAIHHLNNIDIACDLDDDTPLKWTKYN